MELSNYFDPYERPPDLIKALYKKYQRASSTAIDSDSDILNLSNLDITANSDGGKDLRITGHIGLRSLEAACSSFGSKHAEHVRSPGADLPVYESRAMPGKDKLALFFSHFLTCQDFSSFHLFYLKKLNGT